MIDPLIYAPFIGSIFLGIGGAIIGAILFLQKKMLVSETISHAIYPGALASLFFFAFFNLESQGSFAALSGAFVSGWLGLASLRWVEQKLKIKSDSALCLILSLFFGFGTLLASLIQNQFPIASSQAQILLFGQAATLSNSSIPIYAVNLSALLIFLFTQFSSIKIFLFDPNFARSSGVNTQVLDRVITLFLLIFIVLSIRFVGVVMVAGVLIAPSIGARQWTDRIFPFFLLSAFLGGGSASIGCLLSLFWDWPTGPTIVLTSSFITFFSLLFAPKKGLVFRRIRQLRFRFKCMEENILKELWKKEGATKHELLRFHGFLIIPLLHTLKSQGWIKQIGLKYQLKEEGIRRAKSIVRLHRLWELYLTEELGWRAEKVHASAEEMEHILTPELEERLTKKLLNPTKDPHAQPIPGRV